MAYIYREIRIAADPDAVWDAVRDVGAIHTRLAPGFVVDTQLEGGERIVRFGNGTEARERIVDVDDAARRLAYGVVGGRLTHHSASIQIHPEGDGASRFVWVADLLPEEAKDYVAGQMTAGLAAVKARLEPPE